MILRHVREDRHDQPIENTFEAINERNGETIGICTIYVQQNEQLFPARPTRIYLELEGASTPDALLGAAFARAKELASLANTPSRIFTQVEPKDEERMQALTALGFKDTDGLIRMHKKLPAGTSPELPLGCVVVRDTLNDPIEQKFFLDRYNQLYGESADFEWLQELREHASFTRTLLVASTGMVGEIIHWCDNDVGEIGWLFVSKKWRKKGIAQRLIELVCASLERSNASALEAEVQARIPYLLRTMERTGFHQKELLLRYPGVDIG